MPLDPEAAAWLERERNAPLRSSLTVAETRAAYARSSTLMADRAPGVETENVTISGSLQGRVYRAPGRECPPLLVWLHGGRFFSGGLETHEGLCGALALAGCCRVLAVDYRLAPEHPFPAAIEDALAAIDWACARLPLVSIGGDSAGGNLAAVASLLYSRRHPSALQRQLIVCPMLDPQCAFPSHREFAAGFGPGSEDMLHGWRLYLPKEKFSARDECISPLFAESLAGLPPAMIITAGYDCLRDEGDVYAQRLKTSGVPVVHKRYDGSIHGFFQMPKVMRLAREAIAEAGAFLRNEEQPILVAAGILTANDSVLICQRHHSDSYGMQWEFPGGKVKPGENLPDALVRELTEELGIESQPGPEVYRARHRYPDRFVEVAFFHVPSYHGKIENRVFEKIEWAARSRLPEYCFLEADRELVERIARGEVV